MSELPYTRATHSPNRLMFVDVPFSSIVHWLLPDPVLLRHLAKYKHVEKAGAGTLIHNLSIFLCEANSSLACTGFDVVIQCNISTVLSSGLFSFS
jgi:hypothetical protein